MIIAAVFDPRLGNLRLIAGEAISFLAWIWSLLPPGLHVLGVRGGAPDLVEETEELAFCRVHLVIGVLMIPVFRELVLEQLQL